MLPDEISTPRLKLRSFQFSDLEPFHAYIQDPEMGVFLEGGGRALSKSDTEAIIARNILSDRDERAVWAITMDEALIGAITISFSKAHRISELGYSIKRPLWGQGCASEATQAVVDAAFQTYPDLQRVQASIHPDNLGSIQVAERVGMTYEGTLRAHAFVQDKVADEVIYAVTRADWAKN